MSPDLQQIKLRFGIIGNSPRLNYALETAIKVAPTEITVYIQGESGVGKESFSKIIHQLSHRKHGPFIAINCGAIPEGTINSELFGHEKGAFTGAADGRKGYFETANGGTIFLDEIGELPLETQSRLLRVLENGEFIRVGSSQVQKTDVRVVAATNKDLFEESQKGKFREDLYYRISTIPVKVPALRERPMDIYLLFRKFAADMSEKYKMPELSLTPEAEQLLTQYRWPGNIRQLKNTVEQIAVLEKNSLIDEVTLQKYLPNTSSLPMVVAPSHQNSQEFSERDIFYKVLFDLKADMQDLKKVVYEILSGNPPRAAEQDAFVRRINGEENNGLTISTVNEDFHVADEQIVEAHDTVSTDENLSLDAKEEEMIRKALLRNNGKRKRAADELGISERTLYRKIKEYDLD